MPESETKKTAYIPPLRFHFLTPAYDATLRTFMREERFKRRIVELAKLAPGQRVLDYGCGTGTLTLMLKRACPQAHIAGLDLDEAALAIAVEKARDAGVELDLTQGSVTHPPDSDALAPGSFDRVVSSLVFHHLNTEDKLSALRCAQTLLKPGGMLILADWGQARNPVMRAAFLPVQLLDGFTTTGDNIRGALPGLITQAGFSGIEEAYTHATVLGPLSVYVAVKESGAAQM